MLFFDTSALVKRYYPEVGTAEVDRLIESEDSVVVSSLSVIETVSAFRRKYNRGTITEPEMNALLGAFFSEALDEFLVLPLADSFLQFSFELVLDADLRTLDSLQLSTALSIDSTGGSPVFVCADRDLVSVAGTYGLETVNPRE